MSALGHRIVVNHHPVIGISTQCKGILLSPNLQVDPFDSQSVAFRVNYDP